MAFATDASSPASVHNAGLSKSEIRRRVYIYPFAYQIMVNCEINTSPAQAPGLLRPLYRINAQCFSPVGVGLIGSVWLPLRLNVEHDAPARTPRRFKDKIRIGDAGINNCLIRAGRAPD